MEFKKYKLKEVGEIVGGATPLTSDSSNYDGDIPWITPNDLSNHKSPYISQGERNITKKGLKEIGNRLYPSGTVLFSSRAPIGYVSIAKNELCTNQGFKSIIPNLNFTTPEYLYYLLGYYKHYIEKKGAGTTFKEVSGSVMENIELPFPSLDNQVKIANCLMNIDKKISLNTRMNAELEAMAKQLYDYWFVQFDFPDENGKPYKSSGGKMVWNEKLKREIPEGWEVVLISDLIEEKKSGDWGQDEMKGSYTLRVNCIRGADFKKPTNAPERFINSKNNNRLLEEDDIIVEISGGSPIQATGRSVYVSKGLLCHYNNSLTCSNFCQALTCCDKTIAPYFFYVWNMFYDNNVMFNYEGKTSGIKNLLIDMFLNNNWYLPPIQILSVFATTIKRLMSTKDSNVKEINHLTRLRDSLLPMLMNGQVTIE